MQLTTDGLKAYLDAVEDAFGGDIDYAQRIKLYGAERAGEARYNPAVCKGTCKWERVGQPELKHISTSYIERSNLTVRMMYRIRNNHSRRIAVPWQLARLPAALWVTPGWETGDELPSVREDRESLGLHQTVLVLALID